MRKRIISVVIAAVMMIALFSATGVTLAVRTVLKGDCGESMTWELDSEGLLKISGSGTMKNFQPYESTRAPWYNDYWLTEKVVIENGVSTIGEWAFYNCKSLTSVTIPASVTTIGKNAFCECVALKEIYYGGTQAQWNSISVGEVNEKLSEALVHCSDTMLNEKDEPHDWAKKEVSAAIGDGLIPESLQKNYTGTVSRDKVAQLFIGLIEKVYGRKIEKIMADRSIEFKTGVFSDTSDRAVLAANSIGIIKGVGNGKFDPNGTLTRAQIAAIINRVAVFLGMDTTGYTHEFTDVEGHWVSGELGWPVHAGIINGVGNKKFGPEGQLTTEQTIVIAYRAFQSYSFPDIKRN